MEFATRSVRGSRLAAPTVRESTDSGVRGERLTMRDEEFAIRDLAFVDRSIAKLANAP